MNKHVSVPLNMLVLSERNVRRTPASKEEDEELKASIKALGLLQNLVVSDIDGDRYSVEGGGRRVSKMLELVEEGFYEADMPIDCLLVGDSDLATEVSLAENTVRTDMHVADEVAAFMALVTEGKSAEEIAVRFGLSERRVQQRLRLGNVSPVIMESFRLGKTTLEVLIAFAFTTDQKLQERVWKGFNEDGGYFNSHNVRRALSSHNVGADTSLGEFVGVEAYESAGGAVMRDLFADSEGSGVWLVDADLVYRLAESKLREAAAEYEDRWSWVLYGIDFGWEESEKYNGIYGEPGDLTAEEEEEFELLEARQDEIQQDFAVDDGSSESNELREEWSDNQSKIRALRSLKNERSEFTEEQRGYAGCFVTVSRDGSVRVIEGLVRPGDEPKSGKKGAGKSRSSTNDTVYSRKLMDDLRDARLGIVQEHLMESFEQTFDLLLFQMARDVFGRVASYYNCALDVSMFEGRNTGEFAGILGEKGVNTDWFDPDGKKAFAGLQKMSVEDKQALFAVCVGVALKGQLTVDLFVRSETEAVVSNLGIDFASEFRPTVDNLWGRLTKRVLFDIAQEVLGEQWVQAHKKDKKGELANAMELAFVAGEKIPDGVDELSRLRALAWSPDGFAPKGVVPDEAAPEGVIAGEVED